jgi:hypothetical protein
MTDINPDHMNPNATLALQQLGHLIGQLTPDEVKAMTQDELIVLGQQLWTIGNQAKRLLEPIKTRLREEASIETKGKPGSVIFGADQVTVVVQPPKAILLDDADLEQAVVDLGQISYDSYFKTEVVTKAVKGFLPLAEKAQPEIMAALHHLVDIRTDSPRVSFKPLPKGYQR